MRLASGLTRLIHVSHENSAPAWRSTRCGAVTNQHDLALYRSLSEEFMRPLGVTQRNSFSDDGLDLLLTK